MLPHVRVSVEENLHQFSTTISRYVDKITPPVCRLTMTGARAMICHPRLMVICYKKCIQQSARAEETCFIFRPSLKIDSSDF